MKNLGTKVEVILDKKAEAKKAILLMKALEKSDYSRNSLAKIRSKFGKFFRRIKKVNKALAHISFVRLAKDLSLDIDAHGCDVDIKNLTDVENFLNSYDFMKALDNEDVVLSIVE